MRNTVFWTTQFVSFYLKNNNTVFALNPTFLYAIDSGKRIEHVLPYMAKDIQISQFIYRISKQTWFVVT